MPKQITTHKQLVSTRKGRHHADCRTIGGGRKSFKTRSEAYEYTERCWNLFHGVMVEELPVELNVEEALKEFMARQLDRVNNPSARYGPSTYSGDTQRARMFDKVNVNGIWLKAIKVKSITPKLVAEEIWPAMLRVESWSLSSKWNCFRILQRVLGHCVKQGYIEHNPCQLADFDRPNPHRIKKANLEKEVYKVSWENLKLLEEHWPDPEKHLSKFYFACQTGCRIGEQCIIRIYDPKKPEWGGWDYEKSQVVIRRSVTRDINNQLIIGDSTKTDAGHRPVPLTAELNEMLKSEWDALPENLKREGWLWPNKFGGPSIHYKNWRNRILYVACKNAGLPRELWPRWHDLRHAFITHYLNTEGSTIVRASQLAGHTDIRTTMHYTHFVEDPERDDRDREMIAKAMAFSGGRKNTNEDQRGTVVPFKKAG